MRYRKMRIVFRVGEYIKRRQQRRHVSVVNTRNTVLEVALRNADRISGFGVPNVQAEKCRSYGGTRFQEVRRGVEPQPTHCPRIRIPWTGAVVMNEIPGIFEVIPIFYREDMAPGAGSANNCLEPAHFLHAVNFEVGEVSDCLITLRVYKAMRNRGNIVLLKQCNHVPPVIMALPGVPDVTEAGIPGC
jgi:hypothetical protein